jgi:hypothetical protein
MNSEKFETYPNPSENMTYIKFFVPDEMSKVEINIFDQFGNKLKSLTKNYNIGVNIETFDLGDWQSGIYYYTMNYPVASYEVSLISLIVIEASFEELNPQLWD